LSEFLLVSISNHLRIALAVWSGILVLCCLPGCQPAQHVLTTSYEISVINNAALKPASATTTLIMKQTAAGEPAEYSMDVMSVYCLGAECEVVSVRLFWNPLGVYQRYELPAGRHLTKDDHVVFSARDHRALHQLLQDSQSQVARVKPNELLEAERKNAKRNGSPRQFAWRNPEYAMDRVDATSTPTPVDLQSLVVPGAAYTSLTLWHWAHGQAPQHIRAITRDTASRRQLLQWLTDEDPHHVNFALEALAHRRMFDEATRAAVLTRCRKDGDWVRPAWNYLTGATRTRADRLTVYTTLLAGATGPQRVFLLEKLAGENQIPEPWYRSLAPHLNDFDSYYEVHLFLNLLSDRKVRTPQVIKAVVAQLDRPNPFITRRVYGFLSELPESTELTNALAEYRANHNDVHPSH
jgi:hypothetical protein